MRGRISYIGKRYSKANNKPSKYITLREKRTFVLRKFAKRAENIIFSLVFVYFRFTEISCFLSFPSNENVASFRKCVFLHNYAIFV